MTESEWLSSTDPTPMLEFLRGKASDRKLRLFACAVCRRRALKIEGSERLLKCLDVTERNADNGITETAANEPQEACSEQYYPVDGAVYWLSYMCLAAVGKSSFRRFWEILTIDYLIRDYLITDELPAVAAEAIRDVFGNPYRPLIFDPSWKTPTVTALAQGIYTDRAFDRLPILADALEEASCDNPDLLNHCRSETVHTRGCWAIDLLLNRE